MKILDSIIKAIVSLDLDGIEGQCKRALKEGVPPLKIIEAMGRGMDLVGKKYEAGEYFLPELLVSGETMKRGVSVVEPHLGARAREFKGTIVLGTVEGDIHDIGKNIFGTLARGAGFRIVDLGTDVSVKKFIDAVRRESAGALGMSCLITTAMPGMEEVIGALKKEGLRERVKVILGGAPITEEFGKRVGADAAVNDAVKGVEALKRWFK